MKYLGGKFRIRKQIAAHIQPYVTQRYFEPFCGSAWVGEIIQAPKRIFSDSHPELIALWNAILNGWHPPEYISEEEYKRLKDGGGPPYLRGFVGFGCSFSGKWFGGYARDPHSDRSYASNTRNQFIKRRNLFSGSTFINWDYRDVFSLLHEGDVVYCDPPYFGTTGYKGTDPFDHNLFWENCRTAAQSGVKIFVSEYTAPDYAKCVLEMPTKTSLHTDKGVAQDRIERLFTI